MKVRKFLSTLIALSMIMSMFTCMQSYAKGVTETILSLDFESNTVTPSFTYGGQSYTTVNTSSTASHLMRGTNQLGEADGCLRIYGNWLSSGKITGFRIPGIPSLKDIGGGKIVISWDEALNGLDGVETPHYIYMVKKNTSTGAYENHTMNLYCNNTNMYIFGKLNDNNTFKTIGARPADGEWHSYDLVLYHGTTHVELYRDGTKIFDETAASKTVGSGYVITGLCGDSNPLLEFQTKYKSKAAVGMLCDNIKVERFEGENPKATEDFSSASLNTAPSGAYYNRPKTDDVYSADFDVESGVYGKSASDQSLKIVKNTAYSNTGSQDLFYQRSNPGLNFEEGGTVRFSFSVAFDKVERIMGKYISVRPIDGTYQFDKLVSLSYGKLSCLKNSTPVNVNWEAGKWYKFDIYVTPGSDDNDEYSTATVYMNGKKMFEDIQMENKSFTRIDTVRIGETERVNKCNDVMYIDDFEIESISAGEEPVYPNISISSSDEDICIVDDDTIFVDGTKTAADVASAITVTGGTKSVISGSQAVAEGTENATDCYLLVSAANGGKYLYPIVDRVDRYVEDFSSREYTGAEMKDWTSVSVPTGKTAGTKGGAFGLSGKASSDQSYKNINGYVGHEYKYEDAPLAVDKNEKVTIEFSLLMNDMTASENMAFVFKYKDTEGETKGSALINLLYLSKGKVQAFTTNATGQNICSYSKDQWNKFAIEIDPTAFTANIYHNGELAMENQSFMASSFDATDCEMINIYRFKYEHSGNSTADEYSAIDDFKVYLGAYKASEDALTVTSEDYTVQNGWIAITEETDIDTFNDTVEFNNCARMVIFDDKTMQSTELADDYEAVCHNQLLAVETTGGAIHYYRIVDQSEKTAILSQTAFAGADANSLTEVNTNGKLELNTYRGKATYEKYNNDPEYAYVILRSNIIDTPDDIEDIRLIKRPLVFGLNDIESDTIEIEDTDDQLKAMVWSTDLYPLSEVWVNSFVKTTPTSDAYSAPTAPTVDEIKGAITAEVHPRLMVTDFNALANLIKTNPTYKKWYYYNKGASNENKHSVEYFAQLHAGYSMPTSISESATFRERVIELAFYYKISSILLNKDNSYYKNLVWNYLEEAKDWADWGHNDEFLKTADMIMAYAIAYDWLYDDWTDAERATIRNTLKTKGLKYAESIILGNPSNYSSWLNREDNWNAWCNSAVILGALAIVGDGEAASAHQYTYLARKALENLPTGYQAFGSDGDWNEGTGYWETAMSFLAIALSSCETALGSDFGHKYAEGLSETGFYGLYMSGKDKAFGLNDAGDNKNKLYFDFYFGKLFNDKYLNGLRYYQLQELDADATLYDLIWYDKSNVSTKFRTEMPFDKYFSGIETVAMRAGGFLDNTTAYAALHAGYNNVNHGHLDGGTFAYETNGVRWAIDLGADGYNLFNYFQTDENAYQGKSRWDYYRCRAEGHNTWVINPGSGAEQRVEGEGQILKNSFTKGGTSYSIADLTDFYSSNANSVKRGIMLNKTNGSLLVRDEISLKSSSTLYWFMHTKANITISGDGKSAILAQDGRRLWVGIIEGNGTFTQMSATPLTTSTDNPDNWPENSDNNKQQDTNTGVNKLSIKYTGKSGTLNQTVYMVELEDGQSAPATIPQSTSLNNWEE